MGREWREERGGGLAWQRRAAPAAGDDGDDTAASVASRERERSERERRREWTESGSFDPDYLRDLGNGPD